MSNSDRFDDINEGIVPDNDISSKDQLEGVLDGPDVGAEPAEVVDDADERSNDEFDGIKQDNIIDNSGFMSEVGQRDASRTTNYQQAEDEADQLVDEVSNGQNSGRSRVAY
ncbi:hypothetical protein JCM8097_006618 [Rhodosporidiobolus ruineniae]